MNPPPQVAVSGRGTAPSASFGHAPAHIAKKEASSEGSGSGGGGGEADDTAREREGSDAKSRRPSSPARSGPGGPVRAASSAKIASGVSVRSAARGGSVPRDWRWKTHSSDSAKELSVPADASFKLCAFAHALTRRTSGRSCGHASAAAPSTADFHAPSLDTLTSTSTPVSVTHLTRGARQRDVRRVMEQRGALEQRHARARYQEQGREAARRLQLSPQRAEQPALRRWHSASRSSPGVARRAFSSSAVRSDGLLHFENGASASDTSRSLVREWKRDTTEPKRDTLTPVKRRASTPDSRSRAAARLASSAGVGVRRSTTVSRPDERRGEQRDANSPREKDAATPATTARADCAACRQAPSGVAVASSSSSSSSSTSSSSSDASTKPRLVSAISPHAARSDVHGASCGAERTSGLVVRRCRRHTTVTRQATRQHLARQTTS